MGATNEPNSDSRAGFLIKSPTIPHIKTPKIYHHL
jgi:hypothetical protein